MKQRIIFGLAALASLVLADVTYNVVGYPSTEAGSFGVLIDGQLTKLTTSDTTFPLWSGTVAGASASTSYKYVHLDPTGNKISEEAFSRTLKDAKAIKTPNEFFDRPVFYEKSTDLPNVPQVYKPWVMSPSDAFNDADIATFHLTADGAAFDGLQQKPLDAVPIKANVRYINRDVVLTIPNVTFAPSGKSSMEFNKLAWRLSFDKKLGQKFFSREDIKLRSETSDPTIIREKVYIDVLNAMGLPTQQGVWVRLFVNSRPVGLYLMVDDIGKQFLKETIHHGEPKVEKGSLWQMNAPVVETQADFQYLGPDAATYPKDCYKLKNAKVNATVDPMVQLIQLMKDLQDFNPQAPGAIAYWESRIDLDGFLKNMAMEFLAGSWDAYWYSGSNFFLYFNPTLSTKGLWQWISTDFDGTFGDGDPTDILTTYQGYADFKSHDRPFISKLILGNTQINALFEQTLKEIVGWAFKPEGLFPRIDAYEKMLAKDAEWDASIDRTQFQRKDNKWTIQDFRQGLIGPVTNMNLGVKPWIEGRTKDLQSQLNFTVQPGAKDRVDRQVILSKGGNNDASAHAADSAAAGHASMVKSLLAGVMVGL
ncbi:hypothetical protein BGW38_002288, partial [Lunasporangiospora selenospora]